LVQQGLTAARVGDIDDARRLLTQATEQMPDSVDAWLALAGVVDSLEEKERCFTNVLSLDPDNRDAQAGLVRVQQKLSGRQAPVTTGPAEPTTEPGVGFCYRHPNVETGLRCNRCNKFICARCAVRTPVGFRCPDCIREQEDRYYTGGNLDYVIAAVVAFPLSLIAAWLFTSILGGFGFFILIIGFFAAPFIAGLIAEAVRWAVGRRRSRYLSQVVIGAFVLGVAPFLVRAVLFGFLGAGFWGLIAPSLLLFLGITTISARLR